jgi:hypothetical protein
LAKTNDIELPEANPLNSPETYPLDDNQPGEDYALYARAFWDEQEEAMASLHDVWVQNMLFLSNRQWWKRSPLTGAYQPEIVPPWREQPVSNLSLAFFKTFLAKATKQRPAWQVVPASSDPEDVHSSQLAEEVLEAKWVELRLGRTLRKAVAWCIATGNSFLYPYWNTDTGRIRPLQVEMEVPVFDPETGEALTDESGEPVTETVMCPCDDKGEPLLTPDGRPDEEAEPAYVDEGDVGVKVYSPFQVRVSPGAETDDEVTVVVIAEVLAVREAKQRWPAAAEYIKGEDVGRLEDMDRLMDTVIGTPDTQFVSAKADRQGELPKCLVLHYHERPSPGFPKGRYWVSCNKDVLLEEPGPLPDGIWPCVVHLSDVEIPGRYHAMATLESIVGLNREYNEINGAIKEHHNLMAKGKWLAEKGSGVRPGMITNAPAEVLPINTGFIDRVKQADIKPLPAAVYHERERVLGDWELVSGIHRASMGQAPKGVTAGVAILQLQEADDTDMGPFLAMLEEGVAELAGAILRIVQERYEDERLINVAGPNRRYLARSFRGSDLSGMHAVVPVAESSFPWSKTARQEMVMSLAMKMPQLFTDPETMQFDRAQFARLLPVGGLESLTDHENLDVQEALREEEMFETYGTESMELPAVEFWQDHMIHGRSHKKVLKSAKFRTWPPEAQQALIMHVQEHDAAMQQAAMQQALAAQGIMPGEEGDMGSGMGAPTEEDVPSEAMPMDNQPAYDYDPGVDEPMIGMDDPYAGTML